MSPASLQPTISFLQRTLGGVLDAPTNRPFVTLTYAQSLDAKIAGKGNRLLILSGKESMLMTHWMRTMHDGILIGIGTAINDDPQLNTRHLPPTEAPYPQPQPIILDSECRLPLSSKLLQNFLEGRGRCPWVICTDTAPTQEQSGRRLALEEAGVKVIPVGQSEVEGHIDVHNTLSALRSLGISSLMVEGGQRVISSFLRAGFDRLVVTVSPTIVGPGGVSVSLDDVEPPKLIHIETLQLGKDSVLACKVDLGNSPRS